MHVQVRYLDNLRLEARFDDFSLIADQPIRYQGDGSAPGPFDYFLASSAMCAAYFVKVYCNARKIPTEDIVVTQDNTVDPNNRYQQTFNLKVQLPPGLSDHHREGIIKSMDRCSVKRVIQNTPHFNIEAIDMLGQEGGLIEKYDTSTCHKTLIAGKDAPLEETIEKMTSHLAQLGIKIEIASWRNPVPHVWSVHIRDADSPVCFSNGKGATKDAALCSALGEYLERISNNYFYNDYFLGQDLAHADFVHYPNEKWFVSDSLDHLPSGLMDEHLLQIYNPDGELKPEHLIDMNSGNRERGICALPYQRQSDGEMVYIPVNLIGNLFVSNGMSAGNTQEEARVQALSEIFERAVKNQIILEEMTLPDVPRSVLQRFPNIVTGIEKLEAEGFPIVVKDASLGGRFPVMCVTLMNPKTGGVFASFGAHPQFEVALERSLTELLQGRSFEGFNVVPPPSFNSCAVQEHNNIVEHFIDSTGVISWKFFAQKPDFDFCDWNFSGSTKEEYHYLMNILHQLEKEVYIADYEDLGAHACRILVPDYSEIYQREDLIWDNHNIALTFREDILNLHNLSDSSLARLLEQLQDCERDDYMKISELIGICFDENSVWGQLTIVELKALLHLALGQLDLAKEMIEMMLMFNDNSTDRQKFFRALNVLLDLALDEELDPENYWPNLTRIFGIDLLDKAQQSLTGSLRFYGLTPTDTNLSGLDKHLRLLESYRKLHQARTQYFCS